MPLSDLPRVDEKRCSACGRCVAACPHRLFTLEESGRRKAARLTTPERCDRCGRCRSACPLEAIT
ncbi:MAG TPA: 4Fe-4S binding protein [Geobacteraceae bacterium]